MFHIPYSILDLSFVIARHAVPPMTNDERNMEYEKWKCLKIFV